MSVGAIKYQISLPRISPHLPSWNGSMYLPVMNSKKLCWRAFVIADVKQDL